MEFIVRAYLETDLAQMTEIWNAVVQDGQAFPQIEPLTEEAAKDYFAEQSHTGVAVSGDEVVGLYILHPNNIGRCGHISNASYAVKQGCMGRGIGEKLVRDCIKTGAELGFRLLQFNAVVATNTPAIRLYDKLGFHRLGRIPKGFLLKNGTYEDIILFYIELTSGEKKQ